MPDLMQIVEAGEPGSDSWSIESAPGQPWARFDPTNPADPAWEPSPLPPGITRIIRSGSTCGWPEPADPGNWTSKAQAAWPKTLERLARAHTERHPLLLLPDARDLVSDAPGTLRVALGEDGSGGGLGGVALDPTRLLVGSLLASEHDRRDFLDRLARVVVPACRLLIVTKPVGLGVLVEAARSAGVPVAMGGSARHNLA